MTIRWMAAVLAAGSSLSGVNSVDVKKCHLPIDVFFIQDTTGSFWYDLPKVREQLPSLIAQIEKSNPESKFGIGDHRDKPYHALGELNDWCYKRVMPLTSNVTSVVSAYSQLWASGGRDLPEAQFLAVIQAIHDPYTGWRAVRKQPNDPTRVGARLIVLSTDATPHEPEDYKIYAGEAPIYLAPFPEDIAGKSFEQLCTRYDYPSDDQLADQLAEAEVHLGFLTPSIDAGVVRRYKYINDVLLGNPPGLYQFIDNRSENFAEGMAKVIATLTEYVCGIESGEITTTTRRPLRTTATKGTENHTRPATQPVSQHVRPGPEPDRTGDDSVKPCRCPNGGCCNAGCCNEDETGYGLVINLKDPNAKQLIVNYTK